MKMFLSNFRKKSMKKPMKKLTKILMMMISMISMMIGMMKSKFIALSKNQNWMILQKKLFPCALLSLESNQNSVVKNGIGTRDSLDLVGENQRDISLNSV